MSVSPLRVVENDSVAFDDFWLLYPRRVAKKDAAKAWMRLSESDRMAAIVGVAKWRKVWATKDQQYIPHASTFLNGARWEDELPADAVSTYAAHQPAKIQEGQRSEMPEDVRALIARMRNR